RQAGTGDVGVLGLVGSGGADRAGEQLAVEDRKAAVGRHEAFVALDDLALADGDALQVGLPGARRHAGDGSGERLVLGALARDPRRAVAAEQADDLARGVGHRHPDAPVELPGARDRAAEQRGDRVGGERGAGRGDLHARLLCGAARRSYADLLLWSAPEVSWTGPR